MRFQCQWLAMLLTLLSFSAHAESVKISLDWTDRMLSVSAILYQAFQGYAEKYPDLNALEVRGSTLTLSEGGNSISCERLGPAVATPPFPPPGRGPGPHWRLDAAPGEDERPNPPRFRCSFTLVPESLGWEKYGETFQAMLSDALASRKIAGVRRRVYVSSKGQLELVAARYPERDRQLASVQCAAHLEKDRLHCWFDFGAKHYPEGGLTINGF